MDNPHLSTRDRSSSSASDHERLDAIRQECRERVHNTYILLPRWSDVEWLLDRLAALEHELAKKHELAMSRANDICDLEHQVEHAEAALLSLQTAVREYLSAFNDGSRSCDAEFRTLEAALLPDPAGTTAKKDDEDTHARVDGDTQAATDRIYRVQQNRDK